MARKQAFQQRSGTISESVQLVRGAAETIAMRIEYLAAIAIDWRFILSARGRPKSSPRLPAAQLASLLAESVDPFLLRSVGRSPRATILSGSSGEKRVIPLPHIPSRSHPYVRPSSVGLDARLVPLLCLCRNVASGPSDIDVVDGARSRHRGAIGWFVGDESHQGSRPHANYHDRFGYRQERVSDSRH